MPTAADDPDVPSGPPIEASRTVLLPRTLVILLELAAAVVIAGGIRAAAWLVAPVFLALVIVITVHPEHARLRVRGLPSWAATTLIVLAVYGVLVVLAGVVVVSVAQLATLLPSYAAEANALLASVTAELARFGVGAVQLRELAGSLNYGRLVGIVSGLLLGITSLLGNLVFLLSLLLFLSIEASGAGTRLKLLARDRAPIAAAFTGFTRATRRYRARPSGAARAADRRLGARDRGVRAVHRGELRADVGDPAHDPPPVRSDGPWAADSGTSMISPSPGET